MWVREEALASVTAVEMLDLPVSEKDAAIEKEFDSKEGNMNKLNCHNYTVTFNKQSIR